MYLDIKTLQLAAIVVCCVLGPVSLAFAPTQRYMQPSRFWGGGLVALALGLALVSLHGHVSDFVSLALGPGLLALALSFAQASARSVAGKEGRDLTGLALLAGVVVLLLAAEMLSALAWLRVPLSMGALGVLAWRVAIGFDACKGLPEGGTLRTIGAIFGCLSLSLFLQGLLTLASWDMDALFGPGVADALLLVALIACVLLGSILLMWVMTERINARIRQLVSLDPLTGALNGPAFVQQFEREASRARRRSVAQFAILLVDIDYFHLVNETAGYAAGNHVLEKTFEILRSMCRDYDLIGRLEGDVFALLTPRANSESALGMAERVRHEIELHGAARAGRSSRVTVSIGIALFEEHGDSWDEVLRSADVALKQAKADGRNRVQAAAPRPRVYSSPVPAGVIDPFAG